MKSREECYDENGECDYSWGEQSEDKECNYDDAFENTHIENKTTNKWRLKTESDLIKVSVSARNNQRKRDLKVMKAKIKSTKSGKVNHNDSAKPKNNHSDDKVITVKKVSKLTVVPATPPDIKKYEVLETIKGNNSCEIVIGDHKWRIEIRVILTSKTIDNKQTILNTHMQLDILYTDPNKKSCLLCEPFINLEDYKFNNQQYKDYSIVEIYSTLQPSEMYTEYSIIDGKRVNTTKDRIVCLNKFNLLDCYKYCSIEVNGKCTENIHEKVIVKAIQKMYPVDFWGTLSENLINRFWFREKIYPAGQEFVRVQGLFDPMWKVVVDY